MKYRKLKNHHAIFWTLQRQSLKKKCNPEQKVILLLLTEKLHAPFRFTPSLREVRKFSCFFYTTFSLIITKTKNSCSIKTPWISNKHCILLVFSRRGHAYIENPSNSSAILGQKKFKNIDDKGEPLHRSAANGELLSYPLPLVQSDC